MLVGVSGGPDSLALLHFLHAAGRPVICASFNHLLRPESSTDIEHVRSIAWDLAVPFVTDSADVALYAQSEGMSFEEAARFLRYKFLFREARSAGAQAVAVGHTADDQAETVLMHFLRGAGLSGLKGMPPRIVLPVFDAKIPLIRPLLTWTRADTEAYCRENKLTPRYDSTNTDTTYLRNRLRHELLPELEKYNLQIRQSLARSALALQGDHQLLTQMVNEAWDNALVEQGDGYLALDWAMMNYFSIPMRRNIFRKAIFLLRPGLRDVDFDVLSRAANLGPGTTDLVGGLQMFYEEHLVYITSPDAHYPPIYWPQIGEVFDLQAGYASMGNDWVLMVEPMPGAEALAMAEYNQDPFSAWLDVDLTVDRLWVRMFGPGDRFEPLGMPGKRIKLSDLFVNLKIPKRSRQKWPLICVGDDIAWVVGLRLAHGRRVTEQTQQAVWLKLKKI